MFFYMPTKVFEEINCVANHGDEFLRYGRKALIVTGKNSSRNNGSLDDVTMALNARGIEYIIFDDIEANPSVETVVAAANLGIKNDAEFVIGIGGGSPMDASKAIAILIGNYMGEGEWNLELATSVLYDIKVPIYPVPVLAVPTTCGTGSEVTGVSVLTVHAKETKVSVVHRVFPEVALVDFNYLKKAPINVIRNTAIDAMSHLVESFLVKFKSAYSDMLVVEGLCAWSKCVDALAGRKEFTDLEYANLMHAATMGGMSIAHTGTIVPHTMSYKITYGMKVPHGVAVGYFLPGYIKEAGEEISAILMKLMGFANVNEFGDFLQDITKIGVLPKEKIDDIISEVSKNTAKLDLCLYKVDKEVLEKIAYFYS